MADVQPDPEQQLVHLPPAYIELVEELSSIIAATQPDDVYQFCANFFQHKLEEQRAELVAIAKSAQEAGFQFVETHDTCNGHGMADETMDTVTNGDKAAIVAAQQQAAIDTHAPVSHTDDDEEDDEEDEDEEEAGDALADLHATATAALNRGRRTSVSAESMAPSTGDDFAKVVIPKTQQQRDRIETSIANNFLFRNLDEEQYSDVVDAMAEKQVPAGEVVIQQGGIGDYFYVVETGALDVYVSRDVAPDGTVNGLGTKVLSYGPGGSFGELALMYNAPRAATIIATDHCVLWALDRVTFRRILMERTSRKRRMYELFLEEVPLLASLEAYERHKIADALESVVYADGEVVIQQGDVGENFYIIESGDAGVCQLDEAGSRHELPGLGKGDYFGELALLNNKPRAATIYAKGRLKCATLNKKAFNRLLGPVVDIIKRNTVQYKRSSKIAL